MIRRGDLGGPRHGWLVALGLAIGLAGLAGCGKKGPPLPPIVRIPAAVEPAEVRRVGGEVWVRVTLPARNVDGSTPADLGRVELYAVSAPAPPPRERFLEQASRVAVVTVAPPDDPEDEGPRQGDTIAIRDVLPADPPADPAAAADLPRRFYAVVTSSARGVSTGPGPLADLPLVAPPPAPGSATASFAGGRIEVRWDLVGPRDDEAAPRYAVYPVPVTDAPDPPVAPPMAMHAGLLEGPPFSEPAAPDGIERCYVVRAVRAAAPPVIEGAASPAACVVPVDTAPPAAPRNLSAVALEGAISLIWSPGDEADLAGYLVLRGEPGDATLTPLTGEPLRVTQFVDRSVVAGRRYVYAVVALDDRDPPNVSAESTRVEETAR